MKKGLVLEGGALRGLFTAGILDVLMENGVRFDWWVCRRVLPSAATTSRVNLEG